MRILHIALTDGGTPYEIAQTIKRVLGNKYNQTEIRQLATCQYHISNTPVPHK